MSLRRADFQTNLARVETELAQERELFRATAQRLADEAAALTNAVSGAGTSRDSRIQRLARIQSDREHVRQDWNNVTRTRLEFARQRLETIRISRRDEHVEADLARLIAVLERAAQTPPS